MRKVVGLIGVLSTLVYGLHAQDTVTFFYPSAIYTLSKQQKAMLDSMVSGEPVLQVKIAAHCDSVGTDNYNVELERNRAVEVQLYLQEKGMSPANIARVYPAYHLLNPDDLPLNRRVDVIFTFKSRKGKWLSPPPGKEKNELATAKAGELIRLENINFLPSRHQILPESQPALDKLRQTLQDSPTLTVEIRGHICCEISGDGFDAETKTQDLSVRRARAIYIYLIEQGISATRLSYKGCGMDFPLVKEVTEADRIMNRRVEVLVKSR